MLKVEDAKKELAEKSFKDIQIETCWKWGSRCAASWELQLESTSKSDKLKRWTLGVEYYAEAIEHAAQVDDKAETLQKLDEALASHKEKASKDVEESLLK